MGVMTTRLDSAASLKNQSQENNPQPSNNSENSSADITRQYAECPGCASRVLLFSQTIQTFCFQCGLPVAVLDEQEMYYRPIKPLASKEPEQD